MLNKKPSVPIQKTLMLEDAKELILFHHPVPNISSLYHKFEEITDTGYINKTVRLTLHENPIETLNSSYNATKIPDSTFYTVPLDDLPETTIIFTQLENGVDYEDSIIIDKKSQHSEQNMLNNFDDDSPFIRAPKGESCFGRSEEQSYFIMVNFSPDEARKIAEAMLLVSESLCSKLSKFEAALPEGAGGRVWNLRKSQNRETLIVHDMSGACGEATIESGNNVHSIRIALNPPMVRDSTYMGIAVTIIHEIAHQFGVHHTGWLNTADFEGALWASHNVSDVTRNDIAYYIDQANREVSGCQ